MKKEDIFLAIALVVILTVTVSANTAPLLGETDEEVIVCESSALSYRINITNIDEDSLDVGISPNSPFFSRVVSFDSPFTQIEIFSDNLSKTQANKVYQETLFVSDGQLIDTKKINITVLETNNPPKIEHLGVETINLESETPFYKKAFVTDIESGDQDSGEFSFTISDSLNRLPVNINKFGIIDLALESFIIGLHNIKVCVTDTGVKSIEQKIGFCSRGELKKSSCKTFQLAVVEENTAPTIISFNSTNLSSQILGTDSVSFQIYKLDPDGLIPDTYWYVGSSLKKIDSGKISDKLTYSFGCDVFGKHTIRAVITDGLLNDSVQWKFDVLKVGCPEGVTPNDKVGKEICEEIWGCYNWDLCQNTAQSSQVGILSTKDYEEITEKCTKNNWNEDNCGFQIRTCLDKNKCNTIETKPFELSPCFFSLEPSCSDKIKNCHDDKCELLVDCGGPCQECPTCSDGIQNQEEEGIDCGIPCPKQCTAKLITSRQAKVKQTFLIIILISIIITIMQIIRIMKTKKTLNAPSQRGRKINEEK
ncbi:MAG: hypothetical protein KJ718_00605 [Nanoarchaeota archaeon]|nr:hypothetical protein [Nanoarchaeota archaeon]MBU1051041.1 hypothetical protein [Nanoarchaeota archaeon]MBU1989037.1 hypothetical protein [Nanoarchaeota archaeon]